MKLLNNINSSQFNRYIVNGLLSTLLHYIVFSININYFEIYSKAVANLIAAVAGILFSFLGSRYYVYRNFNNSIIIQFLNFIGFYIIFTIVHTFILYIWSDIYGFDFRIGFIIATSIQVVVTFFINRLIVFKNEIL